MSKDLNVCSFTGRLGQEPKVSDKIATFSIAVSDDYKAKSGEWVEQTHWINFVVFQPWLIKSVEKLSKGSRVTVSGKMTQRSWESENGQKHTVHQIEMQTLIPFDSVKKSSEPDDDIEF